MRDPTAGRDAAITAALAGRNSLATASGLAMRWRIGEFVDFAAPADTRSDFFV